jgi:hypothetical protein
VSNPWQIRESAVRRARLNWACDMHKGGCGSRLTRFASFGEWEGRGPFAEWYGSFPPASEREARMDDPTIRSRLGWIDRTRPLGLLFPSKAPLFLTDYSYFANSIAASELLRYSCFQRIRTSISLDAGAGAASSHPYDRDVPRQLSYAQIRSWDTALIPGLPLCALRHAIISGKPCARSS